MRILVDVNHPAHVHFFRNAIFEWQNRGHKVAVVAKPKDINIKLLENYRIPYTIIDPGGWAKRFMPTRLLARDFLLWKFCRKFNPDILTAIMGAFTARVGFVLRKPVILWDDTEHHKYNQLAAWPFATEIYSPDCYLKPAILKQRLYAGCHELAYLHPKYFTPDINLVKALGINPFEKYCIIRLVSWQAQHDKGQYGIGTDKYLELLNTLKKFCRPYITAECNLPLVLEPFRLTVPVHKIHHIMAFANLCVGEGATMISESAVLGVPAVYINSLRLGYIDMFERYGLVKQSTNIEQALKFCVDWLTDDYSQEKCKKINSEFIAHKIDVAEFIVNTIEKYDYKCNL